MSFLLRIESAGQHPRFVDLIPGTHEVGCHAPLVRLNYPTVSKKHGTIVIETDRVCFQDHYSRNGTFIGHERRPIIPGVPSDWKSREPLYIGPFHLSWTEISTAAQYSRRETLINLAKTYSTLLNENSKRSSEDFRDHLEKQYGQACSAEERRILLETIYHEFHGDGPVREYLNHPACKEVLINAFDEIYVDLGVAPKRLEETFLSPETYESWVTRTAHKAGRRLDLQHPICEATLENGSRFHAVLPPLSAHGVSVAIRRFGSAPVSEDQALHTGWIDRFALETLRRAIEEKQNIVIAGGTSTGKTSLLNFLCRYLSKQERIITIEDTVELHPPVENLVQLQARHANSDGVGEVTLRQLVQCALRMRPDRLIMGECRGAEVIEMLQALNTGHPGSLTTVHANSPRETLQRLELLALLGASNLSIDCIRNWIFSTVQLIVQVERDATGHRHVQQIARQSLGNFEIIYDRNSREVG